MWFVGNRCNRSFRQGWTPPLLPTYYRPVVSRHSFFSSVYETTIVGMNPFSSWPNVVVTMWGSCQEQFRHQCVRIASEPKCWTLLELDRTKWSRNNVTLLSSTVFSTMRNAPYRLTVNCQTVTTMALSVRQCLLQSATVRWYDATHLRVPIPPAWFDAKTIALALGTSIWGQNHRACEEERSANSGA